MENRDDLTQTKPGRL